MFSFSPFKDISYFSVLLRLFSLLYFYLSVYPPICSVQAYELHHMGSFFFFFLNSFVCSPFLSDSSKGVVGTGWGCPE